MEKFELYVGSGDYKTFTAEDILNEVKSIIQKNTHLSKRGDEGFQGEVYVDYNDRLSIEQLKDISRAEHKMEAFYASLDDHVQDCQMCEQDNVLNIVYDNWDDFEFGGYSEYGELIRDYVVDNVFFDYPYDHFLKQNVLVNIMVDTGDGNYDYTLNNFRSFNMDGELDEESSLLWLVRQQGYNRPVLEDAIAAEDFEELKNSFIRSIIYESMNVTTSMNALTFFVQMDLRDYIKMVDDKRGVILSEDTNCGLYDPWNGAGSVLEISLDNPVILPFSLMVPHIEGCHGFGVDSIYGMSSDFWTDTVVELI